MKNKKPDRQNICNSGEYYVASILSANGFTSTITLGRAEKYDILAVNPKGKTIRLQVKTLFGEGHQWRMDEKDEKRIEKNLFYAFVRLNNLEKAPEYWIVPSKIVAAYVKSSHKRWTRTLGLKKQKHDCKFKGRAFRIKWDKYSPENWSEKCERYYKKNGINLISK